MNILGLIIKKYERIQHERCKSAERFEDSIHILKTMVKKMVRKIVIKKNGKKDRKLTILEENYYIAIMNIFSGHQRLNPRLNQ